MYVESAPPRSTNKSAANAARGALSKAEHMAPADAMAKQPKGGFSDNNSSIMMKERLSQPGAGEPERAQ